MTMELTGASSGMSIARIAEMSVRVAKTALDSQKIEGQAAVSLIQSSNTSTSSAAGEIIDIYA
jgi:hypothetical protein